MPKYFHLSLIFFCLFFSPSLTYAEDDGKFVNNLINQARKDKAWQDRNWEVLLHYKKTAFKPLHSLIDDPKFFRSDNGSINPQAELEATIKDLFDKNAYIGDDDNHTVCRFPARKEWISKRFNIDESRFPKKNCAKLEETKKEIDPQSITLVFPFMYINRPASMFGHTFLRINNTYNDPLLSHGVTYSADMPPGVDAFTFSVKGIFGAYPGHFRVKKYYELLFEYSSVDKRDIWEYDLNITPKESETLFYHLWELADVYSDYWFFDENCSYNILFLLEAARPDLDLTKSIFWEAPSDTVKKVFKSGIVKKINYRPSHVKTMESIARLMPGKTISIAKQVGTDKEKSKVISETDFSDKLKVAMFDLAIEVMRYNYIGKPPTEASFLRYKEHSIEILSERAKYKIKSDHKTKEPVSPHLGHNITSVTAGVGFTNNQFFTTVGFRLGFHSITDIDDGYVPNSQTVVADINLNWNTVTGDVYVKDVTFLSIGAYSPMSKIFKPVSWKIDFAAETKDFKSGKKFVPYLNGAAGVTFKLFDEIYFWLLADLNLSFSNGYKNIVGVGLGANGGLSYSFKWGKILAEGYYRNYVANGFGHETGISGSYIFPVTRNNALTAKFERNMSWDIYTTNISLAWRFYF